MAINKPFHRNHRAFITRPNVRYSSSAYIVDKEYAIAPHHYTRVFLLLQEDIISLFEYIEPADKNLQTFSFRIYELFIRICMEIDTNFKAILRENIYTPTFNSGGKVGMIRGEEHWKMNDYVKVNKTHHLDNYRVEFPIWRGCNNKYKPFENWTHNNPPAWYQAYNEIKHDRNENLN